MQQPRARTQRPWTATGPGRTTRRQRTEPPINDQVPQVWRALEDTTGPGRTASGRRQGLGYSQRQSPTGVEGAGGSCRGAGGRWRGLVGLRDDAPSEARGADGSRAGRRPPAHTAAGASGARNIRGATQQHGTPPRHNKTARPQWGRAAVAVALGFEPRVAVTPHSISSAAPSAARTRYLTRILYYTLPLRAQIDRAGWEQGHIAVWEQGPA